VADSQSSGTEAAFFQSMSKARTRGDFRDAEKSVPAEVWQKMAVLWPLFLASLTEGFEDRAFFSAAQLRCIKTVSIRKVELQSGKEWQATGIAIKRGTLPKLNCSGRYAVHDKPRPWISEPQGITIDYVYGRPLGEITAMLVAPDGSVCSARIPIGRENRSQHRSIQNCGCRSTIRQTAAVIIRGLRASRFRCSNPVDGATGVRYTRRSVDGNSSCSSPDGSRRYALIDGDNSRHNLASIASANRSGDSSSYDR
jgi:hypothetical protein